MAVLRKQRVTSKTPKKRQRVPRTHAGGTWTKSRYFQFIRSALRQAFSRYPVKYQVKDKAKRELKHKKGRQKYEYQCAICSGWFASKDVEVDHILPAGSLKDYEDLPGFVSRMFCEADGLQVLCRECHKVKTAEDKE